MSAEGGAAEDALSPPVSESAMSGRQWTVGADQVSVKATPDADEDEGCEPGMAGLLSAAAAAAAAAGPADEPIKLGARRRADRAASSESSDRSVPSGRRESPDRGHSPSDPPPPWPLRRSATDV